MLQGVLTSFGCENKTGEIISVIYQDIGSATSMEALAQNF